MGQMTETFQIWSALACYEKLTGESETEKYF